MFVNYSQKKSFISKYYAQYDNYYVLNINVYYNLNNFVTFPFLSDEEKKCLNVEFNKSNYDFSLLEKPVCIYKKDKSVVFTIIKNDGTNECVKESITSCLCKRCGNIPYDDLPAITDDYPNFFDEYSDEITFIDIEDYGEFLNECYKRYINSNHKEHIFENPCGIIYFIDCFNANECVKDDSCCWFNNTCTDLFGSNNQDGPNDPFGVCPYGYQCIKWDVDKNYCKACNCIFKDIKPECIGQDCCLCEFVDCGGIPPQQCEPECLKCKAEYSNISLYKINEYDSCSSLTYEYIYKKTFYDNKGNVCYFKFLFDYITIAKDCKTIIECNEKCFDILGFDERTECITISVSYPTSDIQISEIDCYSTTTDCSNVFSYYNTDTGKKYCYCVKESTYGYSTKTLKICCDGLKEYVEQLKEEIDKIKEELNNKLIETLKSVVNFSDVIVYKKQKVVVDSSGSMVLSGVLDIPQDVKDELYKIIKEYFNEYEINCLNLNGLDNFKIIKVELRGYENGSPQKGYRYIYCNGDLNVSSTGDYCRNRVNYENEAVIIYDTTDKDNNCFPPYSIDISKYTSDAKILLL